MPAHGRAIKKPPRHHLPPSRPHTRERICHVSAPELARGVARVRKVPWFAHHIPELGSSQHQLGFRSSWSREHPPHTFTSLHLFDPIGAAP
jgi:hypothetical protein